ncbi:MAG: cation transporter [Phormidesmis priestleyi]|uniref:Cation transporter n=1 Tax=Phormidesmis priestleyi TaxID=268141 RepID=A0A2W4XQU3_9CYAN|nr:MAG: cation transporter [Phormidesmis priestleyi]
MRRCNCSDDSLLQGKLPELASTRMNKIHLLSIGLFLSGGFSLFEWMAGWWSHSLTLMSDAGHMLSDCLALSLAIGAAWLAHLAIKQRDSLGPQTAEIAAALANGLGLLILAMWVVWEAVNRFHEDQHPVVAGEVMLVTAIVGLGINIIAASVLHDHSRHDLNVRGAFLHVLADTVSSAGVIVSAVLIWAFHWNWVDEIVSLCIAVMLAIGSFPLIFDSLQSLRRTSAAKH